MNKITRILTLIMAIVMAFSLTACGGTTASEVTNATETTAAPTTEAVNVCETNGHTWVDATCDIAKTCDLCGETEGEPLGHTWIDATYEAPKTCETCGATEGEALVAYFDESGLVEKLCDKTAAYDFVQTCGTDTTQTTVGKITVENYHTIASDETHAAMDGYEWKVMTFKMHFSDETAQQYGINTWNYLWNNYYICEPNDAAVDTTGLFEDGMAYTINWNGAEYADGLLAIAEAVDGWQQDENGNNYLDIVITVSVRVPVGYDGFIFGLEGYGWDGPDGAYLHEAVTDNTLLFRFD